jgi:hypothetical protein
MALIIHIRTGSQVSFPADPISGHPEGTGVVTSVTPNSVMVHSRNLNTPIQFRARPYTFVEEGETYVFNTILDIPNLTILD